MTYIAFLRGINVGGRTIKMTELTSCFEAMEFEAVKTVLASGNVLFESNEPDPATLKATIEVGLTKQFAYPAKVIVVTLPDLKKIVSAYPFESRPDKQSYIVFLSGDIGQELITHLDSNVEQLALGDGVIYWQVPKGMTLESTFGLVLAKAKYKEFNTVRNKNTLYKLIAKLN